MEIWKQSNIAPDYLVSNEGGVVRDKPSRGARQFHRLKPYMPPDGRPSVTIRVAGKTKTIRVCVLVADAFIGPRPSPRHEVCHYDGNPSNNVASNLRWDTRSANHLDKRRHGTMREGESHHMAKLTAEDITEIRRAYAAGELQRLIAARFKINQSAVSKIVNAVRWRCHEAGQRQ